MQHNSWCLLSSACAQVLNDWLLGSKQSQLQYHAHKQVKAERFELNLHIICVYRCDKCNLITILQSIFIFYKAGSKLQINKHYIQVLYFISSEIEFLWKRKYMNLSNPCQGVSYHNICCDLWSERNEHICF